MEVRQAVIVKQDQKRKAETTYELHIYIVTQVKGSTIHTRRLSDGKTICQDASKFRPLKTNTASTNNKETRMQQQTQVLPADTSQLPAIAAQSIDAAGNDAENSQATPEPQLRQSNRRHKSVFEGHLRDFRNDN